MLGVDIYTHYDVSFIHNNFFKFWATSVADPAISNLSIHVKF